jgi:hypothetical protein
MILDAQESAQTDTTAPAVAEGTSSPEVTEGTSSSDVATEAQDDSPAAKVTAEFLEKYGAKDDEPEVEPEGEAPAAVEPKVEQKSETNEKDDGDDQFRLSDQEFKALPDGAKKRIGHLNARAKKAERTVVDLTSEVEAAKSDREALSSLRGFVEQNGMSQQDVAVALGAFAKYRTGDFEGFLKDITPVLNDARKYVGEVIDADLQSQVDNGYMTEDAAREVTRSRAQTKHAQAVADRERARSQTVVQAQQQQAVVADIVSTVNAREAELRSSDPDYARKKPQVERFITFAMQNGARPRTREEAIRLVNEAYENASAVTAPAPAPKPATPPRPTSTSVPRGRPEAKSMIDLFASNPPPARTA